MPNKVGHEPEESDEKEGGILALSLPLVRPLYVSDIEMHMIFQRYGLFPLAPIGRFENGLVQIIAALEERVRELDPNL